MTEALPFQQRPHLVVGRKSAGVLLRIGQPPVDGDVEDPGAALDQRDLRIGERRQYVPRTAGPRLVVSGYAVFDLDFHRASLDPGGGAVGAAADSVTT